MLKRFTRYVTQSVAGMIGISVYVLADTFFISVYSGADGLAVLNLILPIYGLIYAIGAMIGIGSATRYAISRAKGENTDHYFVQSVTWSILAAVPFMLIGILIPDKALALLGADAGLIGLGRNYVRIILIATPFFMSNYTFTAFARNDGAPSIAMIGSISGSIFNIIFDYIFMFPVGLGFSGAGLATAICPIVTMSVCTIHYRSSRNHVGFHWNKPSFRHLISCCQLGVSAFVGDCLLYTSLTHIGNDGISIGNSSHFQQTIKLICSCKSCHKKETVAIDHILDYQTAHTDDDILE